jgi:hypothetical protein
MIRLREQGPGALLEVAILFCFSVALSSAADLQLIVSNVVAPAGATVQVSVWVATPKPITAGRCFITFDPVVFGGITQVSAFSANGDAYGAPFVKDTVLDMNFKSPSGGIGRLPDLPVFTVNVSIKPSVASGTKKSITLDVTPAPWTDLQGTPYTVSVIPGGVTVAGTLSVGDVQPGGGIRPAGTVIHIDGTGFDPKTQLSVDGLAVASYTVVSGERIDFTLGGPAELQGKRVHVRNSSGEEVEYFPSLPAENARGQKIIFPLQVWTTATAGIQGGAAFQNPNPFPVEVAMDLNQPGLSYSKTTLAPGQVVDNLGFVTKLGYGLIGASAPIRMIGFDGGLLTPTSVYPIEGNSFAPPGAPGNSLFPVTVSPAPSFLDFVAKPGAPPSTQTVTVYFFGGPPASPIQISPATQSGGNWLSIATSPVPLSIDSRQTIAVTVNPAGLGAGI